MAIPEKTEETKPENSTETAEQPKEEKPEASAQEAEEKPEETTEEAEVSEEEEEKLKLPFPTAAVVRIMKANMDKEKMIKKDVKIAMNKWLGDMCARISREMNKLPYVMLHLHDFNEAKRMYEDLENFEKEKFRILAHLDAIKKDIEKLERDLGKDEEEVVIVKKKEEEAQ